MRDDRPRNRPRVQSRRRFADQDIAPARTHRDEVEEEKRKKRLARFGTLAKPKINEVSSGSREMVNKINGKNENLDMEEDLSSVQKDREIREDTKAGKSSKQERTDRAECSKEEKTEKDTEEVGLLDPVKVCASNVEKMISPSKSDREEEEEEEGVGLLVPVEAVSSSEEEDDRSKVTKTREKRRQDRLARFGTLKAPKIEQPFKSKKSAGRGDNTKPLWRDGRVRSRDRDGRESDTQDEEGEDDNSTR